MRRVRVDDHSIAYADFGTGQPLVLLHGFTQDSRAWRPQVEALSDEYRVIAWDAPGAGASPDPPEPFGITEWAEALARFLDAIDVEVAHVGGLSWGGLLAQELYRQRPERVRSLIRADTYAGWAGSLPPPVPEQRLTACLTDSVLPPAEFAGRYLPGMFSPDPPPAARDELGAIMADFHPLGFRLMATALAIANTREQLAAIRVPTLLVWGDADARSPITIADQFLEAIPNARLVVLRGAGHLSNLARPDEFTADVREFLHAGT
jgi:pimeloyl-ACP methyl ester carboxylesterase